ncbi:FkbM family methyltransferase [Planctomycetota bacterium]
MRKLISIFGGDKKAGHLENAFSAQRHFFDKDNAPIIFDVGAYIGEVTRTYREIFPQAKLYCFEPFPGSFRELEKQSVDPLAKLYQVAISDQIGKTTLNVNADLSCNSIFPRPQNEPAYYSAHAQNVDQIEVDTTTIDSFCKRENIERIDILKLDVEGAEIKALRGAHNTLSNHAVTLIYTEIMFIPHYEGGCLFHELAGLLKQYGYTLFNLYNLKRAKNGQLRWGNAIFLSPQAKAITESGLNPTAL